MTARPDPRQFDLFAIPAITAQTMAKPVRLTADGITFDECDRRRRALLAAEVEQASSIETLLWGFPAKDTNHRFFIPHGKPGLIIRLWQVEPGRWITSLTTSFGTGGSLSGFYHGAKGASTREAALLHIAREQVRSAARCTATGTGWESDAKEAKQRRAAVEWLAELLPPLIVGTDLLAELGAAIAVYHEREALRRAAIGRGDTRYIGEDGQDRSIYSL